MSLQLFFVAVTVTWTILFCVVKYIVCSSILNFAEVYLDLSYQSQEVIVRILSNESV